MARVKTFADNGSLLPGDLNSIEDDYETAFSHYKPVWAIEGGGSFISGAGVVVLDQLGNGSAPLAPGTLIQTRSVKYFDPADYAATGRTTKLRIRGEVTVNSVAPGVTLTFGLYPCSSSPGASSSINQWGFGAVVSGTTIAVANPPASSLTPFTGPDFPAPAAGFYVVGYALAGAGAGGTSVDVQTRLQYRHV